MIVPAKQIARARQQASHLAAVDEDWQSRNFRILSSITDFSRDDSSVVESATGA